MLSVAKHAVHSLQTEKPSTAVTGWIDTLCAQKYSEDDYEGIPELVESINLQSTGPTEASRALRKKLKYSNLHGQLRALTILQALVENCGARFQATFANERLVDRIKIMAGDPLLDTTLKRKILRVLLSWSRQFHADPTMQLVANLYKECGGGKKGPSKSEAFSQQSARYEKEAAERAERKARERSAKDEEKERLAREKAAAKDKAKRKPTKTTTSKRPRFNFETEKPKIMATVGHATQSSQNLINALMHVDREKESVMTNARVVECLTKAKADRKLIVRYIQLVENDPSGEYIGTLLATNEQVLAAFSLYDRMSKPIELDSEDEHIEQAKKYEMGLGVPERDDDTISIRSQLSAFDIRDTEVDKLQDRQRSRVQRSNRARANQVQVGGNSMIYPDLVDLEFGSSASAPTPAIIATGGSLSDYSYSSSYSSSSDLDDDDDDHFHTSTSTDPSSSNTTGTTSARSYAKYITKDDEGTRSAGLLDGDDDDPFADPTTVTVAGDGEGSYGRHGIREEWKEL